MSSFTDKLLVEEHTENLWITRRAFTYYLGKENSYWSITVPEGFITDFASIPWWAQWLIPKTGKYNQAAVLHDYLYKKHFLSKRASDNIFLEAMKVLDVPAWKRNLMYFAVVIGGSKSWKQTQEAV